MPNSRRVESVVGVLLAADDAATVQMLKSSLLLLLLPLLWRNERVVKSRIEVANLS